MCRMRRMKELEEGETLWMGTRTSWRRGWNGMGIAAEDQWLVLNTDRKRNDEMKGSVWNADRNRLQRNICTQEIRYLGNFNDLPNMNRQTAVY